MAKNKTIETFKAGLHDLWHPPKGNLSGLDMLRSLAIVLVFSTHLSGAYTDFSGAAHFSRFPLFYFGWTGVDLFFVLSGYLIGRQLWKELRATGHIRIGRFLLRRGFRIWPLYFSVLLFLVLFLGKMSKGVHEILPDLFCISNYIKGQVAGGWSLSTEEQFYIIVPFSVLLMNRWFKPARQYLLPVILLFALPLIRFAVLSHSASRDVLYTPIHTHCDGLLMGVILAWASTIRPQGLAPRSPRTQWLLPAGACMIGVGLRALDKDLFAFSALAMIYGGMTLFMLRLKERSLASRLTSWPGFYLMSRLSYGVYLNHFEIIPRLVPALLRVAGPKLGASSAGFAVIYGMNLAAALLVATLTFLVIERPFLLLREKVLK